MRARAVCVSVCVQGQRSPEAAFAWAIGHVSAAGLIALSPTRRAGGLRACMHTSSWVAKGLTSEGAVGWGE